MCHSDRRRWRRSWGDHSRVRSPGRPGRHRSAGGPGSAPGQVAVLARGQGWRPAAAAPAGSAGRRPQDARRLAARWLSGPGPSPPWRTAARPPPPTDRRHPLFSRIASRVRLAGLCDGRPSTGGSRSSAASPCRPAGCSNAIGRGPEVSAKAGSVESRTQSRVPSGRRSLPWRLPLASGPKPPGLSPQASWNGSPERRMQG